jgi:hypothetical protein
MDAKNKVMLKKTSGITKVNAAACEYLPGAGNSLRGASNASTRHSTL